ncbi:MAG: aminotransferase class V-fold PLP-dependent enzyme, partial [Gemmatimonadota bacterium]
LWVRPTVQARPYMTGGTGTRSDEPVHPTSMPDALEAGTSNTPGIVTLSEGVRFVRETGVPAVIRKGARLLRRTLDGLAAMERIELLTPPDPNGGDPVPGDAEASDADGEEAEASAPARVPVVLFNIGREDPAEVAYLYDQLHAVSVRAGVHCAPWAHRWIGTLEREPQGAVRASLGFFNTEDEVDRFLEATKDLVRRLDPEPSR